MSTIIKAAAVQISPVLYSRQGTVEKVVRKISDLGKQGVQFATFPEDSGSLLPYFSFIQAPLQNIAGPEQRKLLGQAVTVPSPATDAIGEAAKQAGVVVSIGVNERDGGTLYNTQLLFDADGTLMQRRRKISPTYHERMIWGQGDGSGLRAVDTKVGRIGQLACWELWPTESRSTPRCIGAPSSASCFPSRRKSMSASMHWNLHVSSSVLPAGWMPASKRKSPRTLAAASVRSPADASPRSWPLMAPYSGSPSARAKAWSLPTSTSL